MSGDDGGTAEDGFPTDEDPDGRSPSAYWQHDSRVALRAGIAMCDLTDEQVWIEYAVMGGSWTRRELFEALAGERAMWPAQHDRLAAALNDRFVELGWNHLVLFAEDVGRH